MFLKNKIPSILGVVILVMGLGVGVFLIGQEQVFRLGASPDLAPSDVRISNVTDSSFTVSWTTQREAVGYLSWGETTSLGKLERQVDASLKRVHSVTVREVNPQSNYFFVVNSGGEEFDNNGIPWSVQTGPSLSATTSTALASGVVLEENGSPAANALVYINSGKISQLSAVTSTNGTWTIPLSVARTKTGTAYANLAPEDNLEIFVQGGSNFATAQSIVSNANPIPDITLGQTYDFTTSQSGTQTGLPEANLDLPEGSEDNSAGFLDISGEASDETTAVTLESIDESGEVIFTTSPEFFGDGPPNTQITITVESDPITANVRTSSSGAWSWTPPSNLEEGEHTITIRWTDASGFLRTLTRTFIVQAAEGEPSFESTPSGNTPTPAPTAAPTASPSPTPTPTKSPTPSPSPTLSPTPSPTRASIPSTESGIPEAGSLTPTLILASIGLLLLISGIVISNKNTV